MKDYTFSVPQDVVFGAGSCSRLPQLMKKMGASHAFFVSDPQLAAMGVVKKCMEIVTQAGLAACAFTETEANPSVETVEAAKKAFLSSGADLLVALGGGSSMDVAKAVAVVAKYGGCITEYEGAHKVPGETIPQIAIPTTAGTGSEVTAFSVITDHSRNYKLTVFDYRLIPKIAVLDPELLTSVSASVAAACGMDAFIHALEAYISLDASPFTDALAQKAMEYIGKNIRRYVANRADIEAAGAMLSGSLLAGIAFSWARLGNVHAMSHPLSANFNIPHGVANSVLLPTVVEYNALADQGKYYYIFSCLANKQVAKEEFEPSMLAAQIRALNEQLGIPATLRELGVTEDAFDAMADDAMKSGNIAVNPRMTTKKDILMLYQKAMGE